MLLNTFWTCRIAIAARIAEEQLYPESWNEIDSTGRLRPDPRQSRVPDKTREAALAGLYHLAKNGTHVIVPRRVAVHSYTEQVASIPAADWGVAGHAGNPRTVENDVTRISATVGAPSLSAPIHVAVSFHTRSRRARCARRSLQVGLRSGLKPARTSSE